MSWGFLWAQDFKKNQQVGGSTSHQGLVITGVTKNQKILVSVKFLSAILRPEMAASILWTPGKMCSFCRKTHVHKIPLFRGILGFFLGGGGEVPILFLCAWGFI